MVSKQEFHPGFQFGTYTGNGGLTQAITGLGFQPKHVIIYPQLPGTTGSYIGLKCSDDGINTFIQRVNALGNQWEADHIISLDADGFTVGDGSGGAGNFFNVNLRNYAYQTFVEGV